MYCTHCGKEMDKFKKFHHYSETTGKKVYEITWKCPKYTGFWSNHDLVILDEFHEPIFEEENE